MTPRATLSPAWLGLFALASFGGLVVASFASGYHLVMKTPPRAEALPVAPEPAPAAVDEAGAAQVAPTSEAAASEPASARAVNDPSEAVVRQNLPPDRARVWAKPESKKVVARLPSKQRVAVLGRQGSWLRIEYKRRGKQVSGWTLESNLQLE